jgi:hypothetical protein
MQQMVQILFFQLLLQLAVVLVEVKMQLLLVNLAQAAVLVGEVPQPIVVVLEQQTKDMLAQQEQETLLVVEAVLERPEILMETVLAAMELRHLLLVHL